MRTLIEQDPAAFALPGGAPSATGIVSLRPIPIGHDPTDAGDLPQFAVLDQALELSVLRLIALLEHGSKHLPGILVRGDEPLAIRLMDGNRLFHHHMQTVLQRIDADGGMEIMRRCNDDGIHFSRANQFLAAFEGAELFVLLKIGRESVAHRRQFAAVDFLIIK